MQNITIGADGSISMPAPGAMKITIEMDEATFEEFMAYRRNAALFEDFQKEAKKQMRYTNHTIDNFIELLKKYFETKSTKEKAEIKEQLLEIASDWALLRGDK